MVGVDEGNNESYEVEDFADKSFESSFLKLSDLWSTDRALGRWSWPVSLLDGLLAGSDLEEKNYNLHSTPLSSFL